MKLSTLSVVAMLLAGTAMAADPIKVSTGDAKGTYSNMFKSIQSACGDKIPLQEVNSGGSDDNINNMIEKRADAGLVQTDTLQLVSHDDPRASESRIRVLVPMHPEEVHVVALKTLSTTEGGWNIAGKNFGGSKKELNSLADLNGVKIGAWGGSYTTARAIAFFGGVQYQVERYENASAALAALNKGEIGAIMAVGGQPLAFVSGLGQNYKLLKIDGGLAQKVKAYTPTLVNYKNMSASGVETVAARAVLVVKNYDDPEHKAEFAALKQCIEQNLSKFKSGTGHHPKWDDVDLSQPVSWANYDTGSANGSAEQKLSLPAKKK